MEHMNKIAAVSKSGFSTSEYDSASNKSERDVKTNSQINNGSQSTTVTASVPKYEINPARNIAVARAGGSGRQASRLSKPIFNSKPKKIKFRDSSISI